MTNIDNDLNDKLELLKDLPKEEVKKVREKFLAGLSLVTKENLEEIVEFLSSHGIYIKNARSIKVLANSKEDISKKISILGEIDEIAIYKQDPTKINFNVIDVYKKVQYCKQIGKSYKKEDGSYESFLFDEALWQQVTSTKEEGPAITPVVEEKVSLEPEAELTHVVEEESPIVDDKYTDIQEYIASEAEKEEIEARTTTFDVIQDELEVQQLEKNISKLTADKKALEDFQKQLSELDTIDTVSFNDLDFGSESFGGR